MVVGIGASAGGLHALERFFEHVPPRTDCAFVVIQHLSPDFRSMMDQLLRRRTALSIHMAEDGMAVEPDHVYLIQPRTLLEIRDGRLRTSAQHRERGLSLPIDVFLESLAKDQADKAVAVILSGTGSDGSRGLRAIKEAGGLAIVQDEATAEFDGMPLSAINTGLADFVLAPDRMPEKLVALMRGLKDETRTLSSEALESHEFDTVLRLLQRQYGVDFSVYRSPVLGRRITRRMGITQHDSIESYAALLTNSKSELRALYQDLLIRVTRFFRDPQMWEWLAAEGIPRLISQLEPGEPIRAWSAACSTGEEAYSLAILLNDYLQRSNEEREVKVFATDVDSDAVAIATRGVYPEHIAPDVPPHFLEQHFRRTESGYEVARALREQVIFARHNLLRDPPFTRLHLVMCRNFMMYLQAKAQRRLLATTHFALKPNGILIIGGGETPAALEEGFGSLAESKNAYQRENVALDIQPHHPPHGQLPPFRAEAQRPIAPSPPEAPLYTALAERFAPAGVLVDEQRRVLHSFGDTHRFFAMAPGAFSNDLMRMVAPEIRATLSLALSQATRTGRAAAFERVPLKSAEAENVAVSLTVEPLDVTHDGVGGFYISFSQQEAPSAPVAAQTIDSQDARDARIIELETALRKARQELQASLEEVETSNEELQSTNEELVSSNEELQGTNEELHSVNEELYTINAEYRAKIEELVTLTNDFENLLRGTQIGTLFLDRQLTIRRFTPAMKQYIPLVDGDIGRPLRHFSLARTSVTLEQFAEKALAGGEPITEEIQLPDKRWVLVRVLSFLTTANTVEGVIITVLDITDIKLREADLQDANRRLGFHMDSSPLAYIEWDANFRVCRWSKSAERMFGWNESEVLGKHPSEWEFIHPDDRKETLSLAGELQTGDNSNLRVVNRNLRKDGTSLYCEWVTTELYDASGKLRSVLSLGNDVTDQVQAQELFRRSADSRFRGAAESSLDCVFLLRALYDGSGAVIDFEFTDINERGLRLLTLPREELIGHRLCETIPVNRTGGFFEQYRDVFMTGQPIEQEFPIDSPQVKSRWLRQQVVKTPEGVAITARDITAQKAHEAALMQKIADWETIFERSTVASAILDNDFQIERANPALARLLGSAENELIGRDWPNSMLPEAHEDSRRLLRELLEAGEHAAEVSCHLLAKEGAIGPVRLAVTPLAASEGRQRIVVQVTAAPNASGEPAHQDTAKTRSA
jgi:two-component system CheB/CheR fusion protein